MKKDNKNKATFLQKKIKQPNKLKIIKGNKTT